MSGFFENADGNKSSKRLIQFIVAIIGSIIGGAAGIIATINGVDVGTNTVYLVGTMVGAAIGGGAAVSFSNKSEKS